MFQTPVSPTRDAPSSLPHAVELSTVRPWLGPATPRPEALSGFERTRAFFATCFRSVDPARETLFVAFVDRDTCCVRLSRHDGNADGVYWPLRDILLEAARCNCAGLVVAHNHPSGDPTPSMSDRDSTRRLATAAEAIDVMLLDHLLFAGDRVASFRRLGLL